jgi:hypothetical protein
MKRSTTMKEFNQITDGAEKLANTLINGSVSNGAFDADNDELTQFLDEAAYLTTDDISDLGEQFEGLGSVRRSRSRLRYLAALMPGRSLHELASSIHYVIDNDNLGISDVRDVLRGGKRDVPIEKIQQVGALLTAGTSLRQTAKDAGVSYDTVERIESFIGIAEARRLKLVDFACDAIRESWSVRNFAGRAGIPKSTAHVFMGRAREVLIELGEIK